MANKKHRPPIHTPHGGVQATQAADPSSAQYLEVSGTTWSGPLPPPAILQGYDAVSPGYSERIMRWAEAEGNFRRGLTSRQQLINAVLDGAGLLATTALCGWALWLGATLLGAGHEVGGLATLVSALVPLVGAILIARRRKR